MNIISTIKLNEFIVWRFKTLELDILDCQGISQILSCDKKIVYCRNKEIPKSFALSKLN